MRETVTLNHVAREAGVSPSTVSRVINGTAQVAPEKHKAVLEAIQRLGYNHGVMNRSPFQEPSFTIGVVTQEISSPFYGEILKGIDQGLEGSPYHPIFASGQVRKPALRTPFARLLEKNVDAMIVLDGLVPERELILLAK
ncbi:LacI family DNA-binding transcriptional regulator, partial [Deinococcus cellulosilyticus]